MTAIYRLVGLVSFFSVLYVALAEPYGKEPVSVDIAAPIKICPKGYLQQGKTCVKTITKREEQVCPKNASLEGGICVEQVEVSATIVCPDRFKVRGNKCEMVDNIGAYIECQKGYVLSGTPGEDSLCVRTRETEPHEKCPVGYNYKGKSCVAETKKKATEICPIGTEVGKRGACVRMETASTEYHCPMGYELRDGDCLKYSHTRLEKQCPKNYRIGSDDNCVSSERTRAMEVCPSGSVQDGLKGCMVENRYQATPKCKKGFNYRDGRCVKIEEEDPSLHCTGNGHVDGGMCVGRSYSKPDYVCADGSFPGIGNICEINKVAELQLSCTGGGYMIDGKCVKKSHKKPVPNCPHGFKEEGRACLREVNVKPQLLCNDGYKLDAFGNCFLSESVPAVKACKRGALSSIGTCVEIDTAPQEFVCPKGYRKDGPEGTCMRRTVLSARKVCPTGSVTHLSKCIVKDHSTPTSRCDNGYNMSNTGCVKVLEKEPGIECPGGYKMLHGMCLKKREAKTVGEGAQTLSNLENIDFGEKLKLGGGHNLRAGGSALHKVVSRF